MDKHRYAIKDQGTPKDFDDPTLSNRAKAILKLVTKDNAHEQWLLLSLWGAAALFIWAVCVQHEIDHLDGITFDMRAKDSGLLSRSVA